MNNWNEQHKNRELESDFLYKLKSNLQDDISLYRKVNAKNQFYLKHLDSALVIISNPKAYTPKDLRNHLKYILLVSRFNTKRVTFDNLLSTGRMNIILNDSLNEALFQYYNRVGIIKEAITESTDDYVRSTIGPEFLKFDYVLNPTEFYSKSLMDYKSNPLITNGIQFKMFLLGAQESDYIDQIISAENIIELINSELK